MRDPVRKRTMFDDLDGLFDDLFRSFSAMPRLPTDISPGADIYSENDRNMIVELQAPGFDVNDITLDVSDGVLEITGERSIKEEHKRDYIVRDNYLRFRRRIALPEGADSEKIRAGLDKGILKVTIPIERKEVKRIAIEAPKAKQLESTALAI